MLKAKIDRKIKTTKRQQNGFEKHTGKCSTLLVIKEMQIQVEILFSAGECVTFPETQNPQTEGGCGKAGPLCWRQGESVQPFRKAVWQRVSRASKISTLLNTSTATVATLHAAKNVCIRKLRCGVFTVVKRSTI